MKRIFLILTGFLLLSGVFYLGVLTTNDAWLVPWFGIAAALVSPLGFSLVSFGMNFGANSALRKLSKVPEIESLVEKARTQQEKIDALMYEREKLEDVVRYEIKQATLLERKTALSQQAGNILAGIDAVEREIEDFEGVEAAADEDPVIHRLREKVRYARSGDVVIKYSGGAIVFDSEKIRKMPLGSMILPYIYLAEWLSKVEIGMRKRSRKKK